MKEYTRVGVPIDISEWNRRPCRQTHEQPPALPAQRNAGDGL